MPCGVSYAVGTFNRMSSVSPVIPPKKKKRTKSKKEGQEDNMASNMNTTMTGPAPSLFQHPIISLVPSKHQQSTIPYIDSGSTILCEKNYTNPAHMQQNLQQNFQPNIQSNIPNNNIDFRNKVQAFHLSGRLIY